MRTDRHTAGAGTGAGAGQWAFHALGRRSLVDASRGSLWLRHRRRVLTRQWAMLRVVGLCVFVSLPAAHAQPTTYVTWDSFEPDRCAVVWLIERHIEPGARFQFFSPDAAPPPGVLLDTPDAPIRRTHNRSAFGNLALHHGVQDAKVRYIARLIHDIEINTWRRKALSETREIEARLVALTADGAPDAVVRACFDFFDELGVPK